MVPAVIPRVDVLAELTGLGDEVDDPPVVAGEVDEDDDGDDDPQAAAPTRTTATTTRAGIGAEPARRVEGPDARANRPNGFHQLLAPISVAPCRPTVPRPALLGHRQPVWQEITILSGYGTHNPVPSLALRARRAPSSRAP